MRLLNSIALIKGGSQGIGRAIAVRYAAEGALTGASSLSYRR